MSGFIIEIIFIYFSVFSHNCASPTTKDLTEQQRLIQNMLQPGKLGEFLRLDMELRRKQEIFFNRVFGHVPNLVGGSLVDVVVRVFGKLGEY